MLFAGDLARLGVGAAFGFGWARLADVLQCAVTGCALAGRSPVRVRVIPAELLQLMAPGAAALVVLGIPFEVRPRPGSVGAPGLVYIRDVRRDLAVDQPAQHRPGAIGRVRDQALGMQVELLLYPFQHGLRRADLGLPDRAGRLNVDNDTMIRVDQVIVGIAEECRSLAGCSPLTGRV